MPRPHKNDCGCCRCRPSTVPDEELAEVIGVARSDLIERRQGRPMRRCGRPPAPDGELVTAIHAVIAEMLSYGYWHVHATLRRQALAQGRQPPGSYAGRFRASLRFGQPCADRHRMALRQRQEELIAN
jgi:hypothetical protein